MKTSLAQLFSCTSCRFDGIVLVQLMSCTEREDTPMLIPTVIESTNRGERAYDIYSRLLANRIVFLGSAIDDAVANLIVAQLAPPRVRGPTRDIALYINSPGGDMTGLFAIHDTMRYIAPDVATICVGQACSAAAVLLAAGAPGKRSTLPNARVLIHQPHGGAQGQSTDIELQSPRWSRCGGGWSTSSSRHRTDRGADHRRHRPRLHRARRARGRLRARRRGHRPAPARRHRTGSPTHRRVIISGAPDRRAQAFGGGRPRRTRSATPGRRDDPLSRRADR